MKITCIIHSLNGGGAERVMAGLASRLQSRGYQITLLTLDDGGKDKHETASEVKRVFLDVMRNSASKLAALSNNFHRVGLLRNAIRNSQPDVVLSFCDATNVLTLLATFGLSFPVIVSERSDPEKQTMSWPWGVLRPRLYRRAAGVIVLTDTAAAAVAPWCKRPPIVIPSAVQCLTPRPQVTPTNHHKKTLLGVGRLEHEKGFDRLISAFGNLASQFPTWHLNIVGEGRARAQLERQVSALGLSDRIMLPGWIRPIDPVYHDADLFVLPSRYEGFPSALLEAMSAGVASIAVDCESGPRAILRNEVDGLLIANNEQAMQDAMQRCMADERLRNRLAKESPHVTNRFGWDAMVDAYERLLQDAIDSHGAK
jgi:GalNAc-alpha-(1->4)-GalNAc-alpha-(1->3)-diNAcBac-PP-undecaprenol alpha-1,4-N-acetyl-D-galactosaminyltransferase